MWRLAKANDDRAIVEMCLALNAEDPGPTPVPPEHIQRTLTVLRDQPLRGRAVVLDLGGGPVGYALLVASWSNELGGEVCTFDEIYVAPEQRGRGFGRQLVHDVVQGGAIWPRRPVAFELEVSPDNTRARRLYEGLGFLPTRNATLRRIQGP